MYYCTNMCVGNRTDWNRHSPDSKNTVQMYKGDRVIYVKPVRGAVKVWLVSRKQPIPMTIKKDLFRRNFRSLKE